VSQETHAELERGVIELIGAVEDETGYFKASVANYLHQAWAHDHADTRIVEYCIPLVEAIIHMRWGKLQELPIEKDEMVSILIIDVCRSLPSIKIGAGKIYSYLTVMLNFKVINMLNKYGTKRPEVDLDQDIPQACQDDEASQLRAELVAHAFQTHMVSGALMAALSDGWAWEATPRALVKSIAEKVGMPVATVDRAYRDIMAGYKRKNVRYLCKARKGASDDRL